MTEARQSLGGKASTELTRKIMHENRTGPLEILCTRPDQPHGCLLSIWPGPRSAEPAPDRHEGSPLWDRAVSSDPDTIAFYQAPH